MRKCAICDLDISHRPKLYKTCSTVCSKHFRREQKLKEYHLNKDEHGQRMRRWRENNPEKVKSLHKAWCEKNIIRRRQLNEKYRNENKEKVAKQNKDWRERNREVYNQNNRDYYNQNSDKINERKRLYNAERSAALKLVKEILTKGLDALL